MAHCCEDKACEVTLLRERHRYVLKLVLTVNAAMFTLEAVFGWLAHSTSLLADSLDMFGDATVYAMSLYAVEASRRRQGMVALIKAMIMLAFGLGVFAEAGWKMLHPILPEARLMGLIGWLALLANLACFLLLYTHRQDNLNLHSTWLCSRNDLFANLGVLLAAGVSYALNSKWPDIAVGTLIAALFIGSALYVLRQARQAIHS